MQSDEWDEFAFLLQMEEWKKITDSNTNSPDLPGLQDVAADLRAMALLDQFSSEALKQRSEKLRTEQQSRRDDEQTLRKEKWKEVNDRDSVSQFTADFQATAADQQVKQERQIFTSSLKQQKQYLEKVIKEQQLVRDEELAWKMEHGSLEESQLYDLFFAESTDDRGYVGVGCVIKDTEGQVVFEHRQCIGLDISHYFAEYMALINGLDVALSIGLRHIRAYGNRAFIYWEVLRQVETSGIVEQFDTLQVQVQQLESFSLNCLSRTENEDAIKLAFHAAEHAQRTKSKSGLEEDTRAHCLICLEKIFPSDIVRQEGCCHIFCFDCLSQHVESEVSGGKVPVRCPQFIDCNHYMDAGDCKLLVCPKVFETYSTRLTEATISDLEKVYCPYQDCSALMCRSRENRADRYAASSSTSTPELTNIGSAECMECHRLFCVECQVPWHGNLTCEQYQSLPQGERDAEDRKLFELAQEQKWRRCGKCLSLIMLAHGCFHMTCRCGNEFCYICGANYRDKKKTCGCELFPESMVRGR